MQSPIRQEVFADGMSCHRFFICGLGVRFTPAGAVPARVSDFFESTKNRESRLFAACDDGEAALDIYRDALAGMKEYVENENIIDVKPYWKMKIGREAGRERR